MSQNIIQYRHKKTGIILTKKYCSYRTDTDEIILPASFVEGSNDYEDITIFFITEDGKPIKQGDSWYYVIEDPINPRMGWASSLNHYKDLDPQGKVKSKSIKTFFDKLKAHEYFYKIKKSVSIAYLEDNAKYLKISKTTLELLKKL